jgi:hypothetical protein
MANEQAKAAPDTSTAAPAKTDAGNPPQIDVENVTMEQLDGLFETGSAELPVKSGGEEKKGQETASPAKEPEKPKAGDEPPKVEEKAPKVDEPPAKAEEEVVETRSAEEIEQAATEASEAVKAEGGDQAAQDAAAEEARKPVAKTEEIPPKVEPAPAKEPEDKSRRFRVKDPIAQAALDLYKTFENTDTPITLAEAERRVRGGDQAPAPKKEEAAPVDYKGIVGTLETEVADIETKLETAGADEGLYTPEISKLTRELTRKVAALESAKRDLRDDEAATQLEAQERAAAWKQTVADSRTKAIALYPAVADDTTPLGKAVSERITAMRDPEHPDHNMLFAGSCPETITRMVAAELGIQPVAKAAEKTPPPAKKPEVVPKVRKVEPASGAKTAAGKGPTPEDAKNTVEYLKSGKATLEELDEAFGGKNPLLQVAV